jgi:ubiquinone/menaquinone biosynthesis C-methylase UbiE
MGQSKFEAVLENNRLRAWVRDRMEVKPMRTAADTRHVGHALHIACGNGSATSLILRHFDADRMAAVDRNSDAVASARRDRPADGIDYSVQDVRSLHFADDSFDTVFDLADLHNFADWERGMAEIRRVLKPGGLLMLEEITRETVSHGAGRLFRALTEHPYDQMMTIDSLREYLSRYGFEILRFETRNPFGLFRYFIIIARKESV